MSREPKKPDRRAAARRRADKLGAQLAAQQRDRVSSASRLGIGPLSFDAAMARRGGWKDSEIARFWEATTAAYQRIARRMPKRHPDLYDLRHSKDDPIYIGPDENDRRLKLGPP
jgi:hypothetical protein